MSNLKKSKDIDFALFEKSRPPMYTAMKYWGKKPHNIWAEYISTYTQRDGIFLDPFSGSAMSCFEAVILGRKAISFDINPLTSFFIEVFSSEYDDNLFTNRVNNIVRKIKLDINYHNMYEYREDCVVQNVKYNDGKIYEISIVSKDESRISIKPEKNDLEAIDLSINIENLFTYPKRKFHKSLSFSDNFIRKVGDNFSDLYTQRNLYVLSLIFNEIMMENNISVQLQLLFSFIKIVHLSTKMCVPRNKKSNRDFSTSWGRSAYMYPKRQMEMNPLLLFEHSALGKQSTRSALINFKKRVKKNIIIKKIESANEICNVLDPNKSIDILYGVIDIKKLMNVIPEKSIDFIITDPPYGGLVQYLDLSTIWLSWLELFDKSYEPNYSSEITINLTKSIEDFERDMIEALTNIRKVLTDSGKVVLTFNNKDLKTWKSLLKAIEESGLKIEKVIHQQNKRTGESNVSDPFGSSASDFYIRCIKSDGKYLREVTNSELDHILLKITEEIIVNRAEPTPYQILFNGVLANLSLFEIDYKDIDGNFNTFLKRYAGSKLVTSINSESRAGNFWWIKNRVFDEQNPNTLTNRVSRFIRDILTKHVKILENDLFELIYKNFPNGLTPDPVTLENIIIENANKKGEFWIKKEA